eukprot:1160755-Pelagomonas_calceolata.AAC.7
MQDQVVPRLVVRKGVIASSCVTSHGLQADQGQEHGVQRKNVIASSHATFCCLKTDQGLVHGVPRRAAAQRLTQHFQGKQAKCLKWYFFWYQSMACLHAKDEIEECLEERSAVLQPFAQQSHKDMQVRCLTDIMSDSKAWLACRPRMRPCCATPKNIASSHTKDQIKECREKRPPSPWRKRTKDEIEECREKRLPSPWRNRPIEESLRLFEEMRRGLIDEGKQRAWPTGLMCGLKEIGFLHPTPPYPQEQMSMGIALQSLLLSRRRPHLEAGLACRAVEQ